MDIVILVCLLAILVFILVFGYYRKKKYNQQIDTMQNNLKKGDKVVTYSGIVGTIEEIFTQDDTKQVIIKSGKGSTVGHFQIDVKALYSVIKPEEKTAEKPKSAPVAKLSKPEEVKKEAQPAKPEEIKKDAQPAKPIQAKKQTKKKSKK